MDHLGEPIDLDLILDGNTTGKTDDNAEQTVQLRPKAPSKPPRTFVSTDLDNPNSRIDLLGEYQKEIDVPESQGFQGGAVKKSESGPNAFNLPYDGNDERMLVEKSPISSKPRKKSSSKKSKKKSKHPPNEHVYAVIDKKSKRNRKNHSNTPS